MEEVDFNCIISFLNKFGGKTHKGKDKCNTEEEKSNCANTTNYANEAINQFRKVIENIVNEPIIKDANFDYKKITNSVWLNGEYIKKYLWAQIYRVSERNSAICLAVFAEKIGEKAARFRLSVEFCGKDNNKAEFEKYNKILGKELESSELIYIQGGNEYDASQNYKELPVKNKKDLKEFLEQNTTIKKNNRIQVSYIIDENCLKSNNSFHKALFKGLYLILPYYDCCFGTKDNELYEKLKKLVDNFDFQPSFLSNFVKSSKQIIYFGTPGSGKSQKVKQDICNKHPEDCIFRTTFHPDTDYASLIGSYKPKMLDDGKTIGYEFVPQIFTNAYCKAWQNPKQEIYLIIEEINRGNCAQIFGDIFQLLDRDKDGYSEYPIKADADLNDYLSKKEIYKNINDDRISDGKLCLPPNLSIIATMNTSDQSLFPMDSAFKRRWDWEYVPSKDTTGNDFTIMLRKENDPNDDNLAYKWHSFRKAINAKIKETTDSEDKQLGSFFIKSDVYIDQFKSKVMFYLWSEVFKEEYHTGKNHFRTNTPQKNQTVNDNSKEEYHEFTFNELYEGKDGDDVDLLTGFMKYLKVETVAAKKIVEENVNKEKTDTNNNN